MTPLADTHTAIPLTVVGCDFRRASSCWRSRLVLNRDELRTFHRELRSVGGGHHNTGSCVDGLLALQTCNRNEWVAAGSDPRWAAGLLKAQMTHRAGCADESWFSPYVYTGRAALRHLLRVALGPESLVTGELQIAGQLHDALEEAREAGTSSRALNHLGPVAGRLLRAARARTNYGTTGRGVHSLALEWLRRRLAPTAANSARVAVIGTGSIGRQLLEMISREAGLTALAVNRSPAGAAVKPWTALAEVLASVDAAVLCTGARSPLFDPEQFLRLRTGAPLPVLDLGIPHQADRSLHHKTLVLEGLDELRALASSAHSADQATAADTDAALQEELALDTLVDRAVAEYRIMCAGADVGELLDSVRRQHRQAVYRDVPRLVERNFTHLSVGDRAQLEEDLQRILRDCADEVFRGIKGVSLASQAGAPPSTPEQSSSSVSTQASESTAR